MARQLVSVGGNQTVRQLLRLCKQSDKKKKVDLLYFVELTIWFKTFSDKQSAAQNYAGNFFFVVVFFIFFIYLKTV